MQGLECPGVDRHLGEDVLDGQVNGRAGGGDDAVHGPEAGRARPRHVEMEVRALLLDAHGDVEGAVHHAVGIDPGRAVIGAVGDGGDAGAHLLGRAGAQLDDAGIDRLGPVAHQQGVEALLAHQEGRGLGLDIADALVGDADVGEDDRQDLLVHFALAVEAHGRQAQPLLLDLGGVGGEAARHGAARIGPVPGVGEPAVKRPAMEKGTVEAHVHQVGAAQIGVVGDEHVARAHVLDPCNQLPRTELHGADEDRQAEVALGDQIARVLVIDAVRTVERLGDHGAEGGADEGQVHLVADLDQAALNHGQGDGIDVAHAPISMMRLPRGSSATRLPGSTIVVQSSWVMIAGPQKLAERGRRPRS